MKAAVFHKPGQVSVDTVEDPRIGEQEDAVLPLGDEKHAYHIFRRKNKIA